MNEELTPSIDLAASECAALCIRNTLQHEEASWEVNTAAIREVIQEATASLRSANERLKLCEAVCHCGIPLSQHGARDESGHFMENHDPVPMPELCPHAEQVIELSAANERLSGALEARRAGDDVVISSLRRQLEEATAETAQMLANWKSAGQYHNALQNDCERLGAARGTALARVAELEQSYTELEASRDNESEKMGRMNDELRAHNARIVGALEMIAHNAGKVVPDGSDGYPSQLDHKWCRDVARAALSTPSTTIAPIRQAQEALESCRLMIKNEIGCCELAGHSANAWPDLLNGCVSGGGVEAAIASLTANFGEPSHV